MHGPDLPMAGAVTRQLPARTYARAYRFAAFAAFRAVTTNIREHSRRCSGWLRRALQGASRGGLKPPHLKKAASVCEVAGHLILKSEFLFLKAVEKVFVGVGSVLFFLDQSMKRLVLRLEFLDHCLVHWRRSFQSACHHRSIEHEKWLLS
jgi:hypothetical protein